MNGITLLAKKELDLPSLTFNLHINQRYDGIIKKKHTSWHFSIGNFCCSSDIFNRGKLKKSWTLLIHIKTHKSKASVDDLLICGYL